LLPYIGGRYSPFTVRFLRSYTPPDGVASQHDISFRITASIFHNAKNQRCAAAENSFAVRNYIPYREINIVNY
jgi:hypothetical protein